MVESPVLLHVYDVTNSMSVRANSAIVQLNKLMRDGLAFGGIFHGAVQVFEEEWSFGYCDAGPGVFSCPPKLNPMYTYRESISLGSTTLSPVEVKQVLNELSRAWPGYTYDLLSRNCNHFCEEFLERLGAQKLPPWVNRFATAGDAAVEAAANTMDKLRQAKTEIVSAGRIALKFIMGNLQNSTVSPDLPDGSSSRLLGSFSRSNSGGSGSSRFRFSPRASGSISEPPAARRDSNGDLTNSDRTDRSSPSFWVDPSFKTAL
eukprot:TRINITY_DN2146_c0_g2_i1.p1 TRINITY_DN2146_c0_g2~~TRINITY_DN2146_c0_g2_i1.p1  ORF type:complete len:261 (-),score=36.32 TRINITY_DN2146_c0_g2_i1:197-979(-)